MRAERCGSILEKITLAKLLNEIDVACDDERIIKGISDDSRTVKADWLFVARKGVQSDGTRFAQAALSKGAVVLWEASPQENCYQCGDIDHALMILLREFYHDTCRNLCVIGVTGTNGKTSVTSLLAQMFTQLEKKVMLIGTGHIRYGNHDIEIDNTTPSACTLAYYFHEAKCLGYYAVIMEVSSHAIDQKRIGLLRFDYIIYTNISGDHLDYHITKTHYRYTKFKLRYYLKRNGVIIVNHDDASLHPLYDFHDHKVITVGSQQAHLQIRDMELKPNQSFFTLEHVAYETKLIGYHNVMNIAQCLVVLHVQQVPPNKRQAIVKSLHGVSGRMEIYEMYHRYVVIDYAHTAGSLEMLLRTVSQLKERRMIVVCGCGGNRDRSKRGEMAHIALHYSDVAIFTSDNPRNEAPHQILYDMIQNETGNYEIFENRRYAIKYAVKIAQEHDIIVIAGKGDEQVQIINDVSYPFSDLTCVKEMLEDMCYEP